MASTNNPSEYRNAKPSLKDGLEDLLGSDRVDSGYGDSLPSVQSSNTDSYDVTDSSRNEKRDVPDESVIVERTKKLNINSETDDGYKSISLDSQKNLPVVDQRELANILMQSNFQYLQYFIQTQDLRYMLAPIWPMLLRQNDDGDTSLHLSIIHCNEQSTTSIVDVLPKPEYLDIYNNLTQTPLHLAVITRQYKIVEKLIDRGADVELVDRNGQTCIHLACQRGDLKSLEAIFKRRPVKSELHKKLEEILETRNFDGLTPLCVAVKENHIEIVKKLINLGADVNAIDSKSGNTALHAAVESNNLPMLSCLIFQGNADPNVMSYSGNTPLHIAVGLELESIAATLIAVGANSLIENMEGDTAFKFSYESYDDYIENDLDQDMDD